MKIRTNKQMDPHKVSYLETRYIKQWLCYNMLMVKIYKQISQLTLNSEKRLQINKPKGREK